MLRRYVGRLVHYIVRYKSEEKKIVATRRIYRTVINIEYPLRYYCRRSD